MTVRFSSVFKRDLLEAETRYATISPKLGDDFHARVKEAVRTIIVQTPLLQFRETHELGI